MAGTIPLSMTQQLDEFGDPLAGGLLYLIQAGTVSTPQNGYQDSALTLPWPNPIVLSASGRIPQFFLADGSIKIRLTNVDGVEVPGMVVDGLIVTGASSGGGGGSPVDATTVLATGDLKARYGTGVLSGFVRGNGRTIGSATSGASERANADTQALFGYLWDADPNLTVSTGRGASSAADWAANKTIAVPDFRGRALAFLDDMGNSAAGRLTSSMSPNAITLGAAGGAETYALTLAQLPTGITAANATQAISVRSTSSNVLTDPAFPSSKPATGGPSLAVTNSAVKGQITSTDNNSISVTSNNTGGVAHPIVQATMLATIYLKL